VGSFVKKKGLLPNLGYRVRTLHGLAHDIVRERPGLVNLGDNFQIIDEREAESIRNEVAQAWLHTHSAVLDDYLDPEMDESRREWLRRNQLPKLVQSAAMNFIRYAKDMQLTPERLRARLDALPIPLPLVEMGYVIYADYQRALAYRGAVDFDDLIRLALQALETDDEYRERLSFRWPYILEDEAQDSSRLQEAILGTLVGSNGNWVRVGDPNQAIYETFTTANPRYLREFVARKDVVSRELPNSGRSTRSIIDLANYLVRWTQEEHPEPAVRDALKSPPEIEPTPADDPQPNPVDDPTGIYLIGRKYTSQEEIKAVVNSLARWLPEHPDETVAVLAPRNDRGFALVDELRRRELDYVDSLLRSSSTTRFSAGVLGNLLQYLSDPSSARKLARIYQVWRREDREDPDAKTHMTYVSEILRKVGHVEDYLWPGPGLDWLEASGLEIDDPTTYYALLKFRELVRRWQGATLLPVDQIVLTLAHDLLTDPAELAISHRLAALLRQASQAHPSWRLPELTGELGVIARNERRFLGFSGDDVGFNPENYRGKVVVSTMHKAKGLEWDRVYLLSVNDYNFPSAQPNDLYISEKWYIRDQLNIEAETLSQLDATLSIDEYEWYREGESTRQARLDYVRERLRLLYVGITRAKRELVVTWNTGRRGDRGPALPLVALQSYWEERQDHYE
jgi:DNA helicase-2/ATP-dependent DNA helicase PcrA